MLETIDLASEISKSEYKRRVPDLQADLLRLQRTCWEEGLASVFVFDGWDFAGKGRVVSKLTQRLEPRGFKVHVIQARRTHNKLLPWMWRFWMRIPAYGEMAIFYGSWYSRSLIRVLEDSDGGAGWSVVCEEMEAFERALANDRYVVHKFFLHIGEAEQKKRYEAARNDPYNRWKIDKQHRERHRRYGEYEAAIEEIISRTDTEWAPWSIVAATDHRWVRLQVMEKIAARLQRGLEGRGLAVPELCSAGSAPPETSRSEADVR